MTSNAKKSPGVGPWLSHDELDLLSKMEPSKVLAETGKQIAQAMKKPPVEQGPATSTRDARPTQAHSQTDAPSAPPPPPGDPSQWAIVYLPWNSGRRAAQPQVETPYASEADEMVSDEPEQDVFPGPTFEAGGSESMLDGDPMDVRPSDALPTAESLASRALDSLSDPGHDDGSPSTGSSPSPNTMPRHTEPRDAQPSSEKRRGALAEDGLGLWGAPIGQETPVLDRQEQSRTERREPVQTPRATPATDAQGSTGRLVAAQSISLPVGLGDTARARIEVWTKSVGDTERFFSTIVIDDVRIGGTDQVDQALEAAREWIVDRLGGLQPVHRPRLD